MSWSTSELRVRLAPLNRFKPSSKIFYWPFQGGTSFVDLLCFVLSCVCYVFVRICLYVLCGHLLGKDWPLGSRLWCLTVSLSLSHWYPGSGAVLDCIDSWSLHPYLLLFQLCFLSPKSYLTSLAMTLFFDMICLFDLILYVPSTIFQLNRDGSSLVEPALSYDKCVLLKDHDAVTPVNLEPSVSSQALYHWASALPFWHDIFHWITVTSNEKIMLWPQVA